MLVSIKCSIFHLLVIKGKGKNQNDVARPIGCRIFRTKKCNPIFEDHTCRAAIPFIVKVKGEQGNTSFRLLIKG